MGGCMSCKQQPDSSSSREEVRTLKSDQHLDNNNLGEAHHLCNASTNKYHTRPLPPIASQASTPSPINVPAELGHNQNRQYGLYNRQRELQPGTELVAMFDYCERTPGELSFQAGDYMTLAAVMDADWWLVETKGSSRCGRCAGYVPAALLAVRNSLHAQSCYFGQLSRKEAERLLLLPGNSRGAFLLRDSETHACSLSLSVLDAAEGRLAVKHYRVRQVGQSGACYITSRRKFYSMEQLVQFYSKQSEGLCCRLVTACCRTAPTMSDLGFQTRDCWEIPRDQLQLLELLGAGQFGEVWRGRFNNCAEVAIKTLKAGSMSRSEFLAEARIMKRLRHRNLVQLLAVCTDSDPIFIVTELMEHGSLLSFLRNEENDLATQDLLDLAGQVACGMAYLESQNFVHRDLAARNILVGENRAAKVADFGLSRAIGANGEYTASEGAKFAFKWTSPEAGLLGKFSIKSDVWSYGVVLFEIFSLGAVPYATMSNVATLDAVNGGFRLPRPQLCPAEVYSTMLDCWHCEPDRRPTFDYLSEYFANFITAAEANYRVADPDVLMDDA